MWTTITAWFSAVFMFFASFFGVPLSDGEVKNNGYTYINMEYGHHERQVVDLYLPENSDGEVGLILLIHGGGWKAGSKEDYGATAADYLERYGCAVAALNYRYISRVFDINDELDDIEACLGRIKNVASEKGITLNGMLLTGGSAGGHLAMLYAYARKDTSSITPKAVISYSGPTDFTDDNFYHNNPLGSENAMAELFSDACGKRFRYKNMNKAYNELMDVSPVAYVDENTVPTVINHAVMDTVVPYSNAETIVEKFNEYGVTYDLNIFWNSNHGLESDPENTRIAEELFDEYMMTYIGVEK